MTVNSVSSSTISTVLQNTVSRLQTQMTTVETENSTGLLANIGLTLGSTTGQDIALHQQMADLNAMATSNAIVSTQLDTASNALTALQQSASSILTQTVEGLSSTPSSTGALGLQQAALGALGSYASMANSQIGGVYVFGGVNTGTAPFSAASQTATQANAQTAFTTYLTTVGASVSTITATQMTSFLSSASFTSLFSGSSFTSASSTALTNRVSTSQTVPTSLTANDQAFSTMAQGLTMLGEFAGLNLSSGAYTALMTTAQSTMNTANSQMIEAGAAVGTMQNTVTQANSSITLQQNILNTQLNANESVNSYDVASQMTALSNQLQVAYSLTAQIQKLSLVNYL